MNFQNTPYQAIPEPIPAPPLQDVGLFCVEFDGKWIPYILATLKTLAIERTYLSGSQHATDEARNLMAAFAAAKPCTTITNNGIEMEDCMGCCIRVENGHLQVFSCGEWTDVPGGDLTNLVQLGSGQPTNDQGPLSDGACLEYDLSIQSTLQTLLPIPLSEGDSIEITTWHGAWSDGSGTSFIQPYFCADGQEYLLGNCSGLTFTDGGDPLPSANHMSVIASVGGAGIYLAPMGSERFIPPGVTDQPVMFQANDPTLGDNLGGVSIHVKVCRPVQAPIAISYSLGSGPGACAVGQVITVTSHVNGPANAQAFVMAFSECVTVTVVGFTGFVPHVGAGDWYSYDDCSSVSHGSGGPTSGTVPTDFPASTQLQALVMAGDVSAIFQVQIRIDSAP